MYKQLRYSYNLFKKCYPILDGCYKQLFPASRKLWVTYQNIAKKRNRQPKENDGSFLHLEAMF